MDALVTHAEASSNILSFAREGRLVQREWRGRAADGREVACLLGAIHPSVQSPSQCNADLMPMWLAELTPTLFDGVSKTAMMPLAIRYGELIARWQTLSAEDWNTILRATLIYLIDSTVDSARPMCADKDYWPAVEAACAQSKTAIGMGGAAAWAAEAAAWAAAAGAAEAAARVAEVAARVAGAAWAAVAAGAAVAAAAWAAAGAAVAAEDAAGAAEVAARVARVAAGAAVAAAAEDAAGAAGAAAYGRIFAFVLDQIDMRLVAAGATP